MTLTTNELNDPKFYFFQLIQPFSPPTGSRILSLHSKTISSDLTLSLYWRLNSLSISVRPVPLGSPASFLIFLHFSGPPPNFLVSLNPGDSSRPNTILEASSLVANCSIVSGKCAVNLTHQYVSRLGHYKASVSVFLTSSTGNILLATKSVSLYVDQPMRGLTLIANGTVVDSNGQHYVKLGTWVTLTASLKEGRDVEFDWSSGDGQEPQSVGRCVLV